MGSAQLHSQEGMSRKTHHSTAFQACSQGVKICARAGSLVILSSSSPKPDVTSSTYCRRRILHTIAEELVLPPLPDNDQCAAPSGLVLGRVRGPPPLAPVTLDDVQGGVQRLVYECLVDPAVLAVMQLE